MFIRNNKYQVNRKLQLKIILHFHNHKEKLKKEFYFDPKKYFCTLKKRFLVICGGLVILCGTIRW